MAVWIEVNAIAMKYWYLISDKVCDSLADGEVLGVAAETGLGLAADLAGWRDAGLGVWPALPVGAVVGLLEIGARLGVVAEASKKVKCDDNFAQYHSDISDYRGLGKVFLG